MPDHLSVDPIRCDGFGMCAELLPERIRLDDWGYPIIEPRPIGEELRPLARQAVRACPVGALRLERGASDLRGPSPRAGGAARGVAAHRGPRNL